MILYYLILQSITYDLYTKTNFVADGADPLADYQSITSLLFSITINITLSPLPIFISHLLYPRNQLPFYYSSPQSITSLFCTKTKIILVADVADPLADSEDEMDLTNPGHSPRIPATTAASGAGGGDCRSSRASSTGSGTVTSYHHGGAGITSSSLAAQIRQLKNAATAPRIIGGHGTARTSNYSSLVQPDDSRHKLAEQRELYDQKVNVATSFNPASLTCHNCAGGPHQVLTAAGSSVSSPTCFVLSDQNFPPALPGNGIDNCVAVIRVEDATLRDLVSTFMRLTRGCDLGVGSVVLLSSLNHLGRVGTAAYAEDLVAAFLEFRATFGGQIRALHGFAINSEPLTDQLTIRSLMEIEAWLSSTDQRRSHSLGRTSEFLISNFLMSAATNESDLAGAVMPLRLPTSLFTTERSSHVGLGWPKLVSNLPAFTQDSEKKLLKVLFDELNHEFALNLDPEPVLDRLLPTLEDSRRHTIIVGGGSHAGRLADALKPAYPEVVDLSVRGWRLSTSTASDLADDIAGILEDVAAEDCTIILQIYDNAIYKAVNGDTWSDPVKQGGKYHVPGKLDIVGETEVKSLFEAAMPILRTTRGANVILVGPLPRFAVDKCCSDTSHITNFGDSDYLAQMAEKLKELAKNIKNLTFMRRLKGVRIVNPISMMGLASNPPKTGAELKEMWGPDPVHPSPTAYKTMAEAIIQDMGGPTHNLAPTASTAASSGQGRTPGKAEPRESWTSSTQLVADRMGKWAGGHPYNSGPSRPRGRGRGRYFGNKGYRGGKYPRPY